MLCAGSFTKQQETAEKYGGIICTRFWKQEKLAGKYLSDGS